ncbi:hypothetical protein RF11_10025 [Thelohanellus kitauei]|uniref:Uncharacterized protein n=1 Tax=Thelohanellus kitauei TaxID=669202 RepID=A0A0C2NJS8_THEKT|nr:hypothetical protein RF11_10025 [Thelohanellus kitauei]
MLIFLKTINFPQITGDVESLFSQYNIKYDSLSEPNRDIKWLLSEFKQAFTISPRNIQGSMLTSSSVIESGLLILTKQGSAIDTVYDFALESIKSVCPPLEVNDVAKLTVGSCVDVQVGDLLPKRTEKNHTSYSSGNMIIQLKDLASRLYDVDIQNPTLTPVSNMTNKAHRQVGCTMAIVDQKYNEYIRSPHDAMDIVMYFFKLLMSEVPLYSWTLDLCLKFAFIFINVRGRYMFQLEKYDSSIFSIFLRYIEIYYLVLKNIPMSENQSVQFKFAAKKTLFIIKSHVYGNMLNEEQNSELIIRVLYILSISCDGSSQSICYLSLCQDYQIKYINLFSDDVSSRYTNTIISQDEVAKLISYYEIESIFNHFDTSIRKSSSIFNQTGALLYFD